MAYKSQYKLNKNTLVDKKRAQVSATFEVLPMLLGFNENVICRAIQVDYTRNIVTFCFAGPGLEEVELQQNVSLTSHEGQEAVCINAPAWEPQVLNKLLELKKAAELNEGPGVLG